MTIKYTITQHTVIVSQINKMSAVLFFNNIFINNYSANQALSVKKNKKTNVYLQLFSTQEPSVSSTMKNYDTIARHTSAHQL